MALTGFPTNTEIVLSQTELYFNQSFNVVLLDDQRSVFNFTAALDDTITATGHDYILNTPVQVDVSGGGTLPAPLVAGTTYYVRDAATNTFKLSATIGGAAINITTVGTGLFTITDLALDSKLGTVALFVRKEIDSYEGLTVRPTVTFDAAPVVGLNSISISKAIALNNNSSPNDILFNAFLLVRGGTSARGNTTGDPAIYVPLPSTAVVLAGQTDSLTVGIARAI